MVIHIDSNHCFYRFIHCFIGPVTFFVVGGSLVSLCLLRFCHRFIVAKYHNTKM